MSFLDSFWSPGYHDGLDALYNKLAQGIVENSEVLALAAARAEMEEAYGNRLRDVRTNFAPRRAGFARDDGASMRRAYDGILEEMSREGEHHLQVAGNIRRMVVEPFSRWSDAHKQRIEHSRVTLTKKAKQYDKELAEVHKAQKRYFNKCRLLEDFKDTELGRDEDGESEEDSLVRAARDDTPGATNGAANGGAGPTRSPAAASPGNATADSSVVSAAGELTSEEYSLAGKLYSWEDAQKLVAKMLSDTPQTTAKVTLLGAYEHVSNGSDITAWLQGNLVNGEGNPLTLAEAEKAGQDLVNDGMLRLIGQVGSKFANSSVMMYQWRPKAFEFAGISHDASTRFDSLITGTLGETISETWSEYVGTRGRGPSDESLGDRLVKEVRELDQKYRKNVGMLDNVRTDLEEAMTEHLRFMERCELDRLKALKAVMLDFVAALSNVVPTIQASVDKLLLYQETVNPANDLRYIIEAYRTGSFAPTVTVYDNYYSSADGSIYGMDLELRSRGDRKHVPYIISAILSHLDQVYPKLDNDEVRLGIWTVNVPLKATHALRREINTPTPFDRAILGEYEPPVVVSALKLYLLELPDSVVPAQYYDIFRAIYAKHGGAANREARLMAVQNTLVQLRVANIATLDALLGHLRRLTTIAKASDADTEHIAKELGACLLHPKHQSALTINDTFPAKLVLDLLEDRERMFRELKKAAQAPSRVSSERIVRRESVENRVSRIAQRLASSQLADAERRASAASSRHASSPAPESGSGPASRGDSPAAPATTAAAPAAASAAAPYGGKVDTEQHAPAPAPFLAAPAAHAAELGRPETPLSASEFVSPAASPKQ